MTAVEAQYIGPRDTLEITATAAWAGGEVIQLPDDGRAAVVAGNGAPIASGDKVTVYTRGIFKMAKATGTAHTTGDIVEWDATDNDVVANAAGDFDVGKCVQEDAASGDTTILVDLNAGS